MVKNTLKKSKYTVLIEIALTRTQCKTLSKMYFKEERHFESVDNHNTSLIGLIKMLIFCHQL